jgi:hypothetical protein
MLERESRSQESDHKKHEEKKLSNRFFLLHSTLRSNSIVVSNRHWLQFREKLHERLFGLEVGENQRKAKLNKK